MKIEELAQLQPVLFERFEQILQQNRLNHDICSQELSVVLRWLNV